MYAVIRTGGKQYRVEPGMFLEIEKVEGNAGDTVELAEVLFFGDGTTFSVGQPLVAGARVTAQIVAHRRGPKVLAFKKIRRQGKQWRKGHRQELTRVRIAEIQGRA